MTLVNLLYLAGTKLNTCCNVEQIVSSDRIKTKVLML